MCLIALAIGAHPGLPLLLASNRDESFDRPTEPLHRWHLPNGVPVVAGRDARDGGTWLGLTDSGRVAMLTNVRSAAAPTGRHSRGDLPLAWLQGDTSWRDTLARRSPGDYGGFNLVVGDLRSGQWQCWSNRRADQPHTDHALPDWQAQTLAPGVYGLSNAALNTPWPKTVRLRDAVRGALRDAVISHETAQAALRAALADTQLTEDAALPHTGVPLDLERGLSAAFVSLPQRAYGTRSSLIAQVSSTGHGGWHIALDEWTHTPAPGQPHAWDPQRHRHLAWSL